MNLEMLHEEVVYQNPFLCMRIFQVERAAISENEVLRRRDANVRMNEDLFTWHYHKEVEFLAIQEGELTACLPGDQLVLRAGDIAVFGSSEPHETYQSAAGQLRYIVMQIDLKKHMDQTTVANMRYFSEVIQPLSKLNYIFTEHREVRLNLYGIIQEIYDEMQRKETGYELAVSAHIKHLLLLLLRNDTRKQLHYSDDPLLLRIMPALDYIDKHLADKLIVEDVAKQVNLSYYYFVKLFKKALGMSFTDYVNFKRIKRAEQLLLTEDLSIAEVADQVGIANLGHFYEMFKRTNGCSPKQFKYRLREA